MSNHPLLTALVGMAMLGGCNLVFTPGQAQPDAGGDGGNTVDGKVDDPNGSDFDGDTILDSVDPCPISSNNTADSDNDGLPNDCDLAFGVARPATQCVLLFRGFPQGSAITGERRFPVVSNARSLQLGGKVTALSANPRIQL
ncbi:MAG TPA: hypothetical protein PLF40_16715, partial [Kofleriaceae bacterium]|nr:hypothetical protein [Kofleriaceae bacterium]